jgi:hypothetical protein
MKWYQKIGVIKPSFLMFIAFLLCSYITRKEDWFPEFFMILAEAALSIVVVLKIIEEWSRRERMKRWEEVKQSVYAESLDIFVGIASWISRYRLQINYLYPKIHEDPTWINRLKYYKTDCQFFRDYMSTDDINQKIRPIIIYLAELAQDISEIAPRAFPLINTKEEKHKNDTFLNQISRIKFDEIEHLITEYRMLIPRAIDFSDNEELGLYLQNSEITCSKLMLTLRRHEWNASEISDLSFILVHFTTLLNTIIDICKIIQKETEVETEIETKVTIKQQIIQRVTHWWLPPECFPEIYQRRR